MDKLFERYQSLDIDGAWIGLEPGDGCPAFCTPLGARIIGWDNGIHYCFLEGFGEMVFCVNPESGCERLVYPLARSFRDFLRLILAAGNTNTLQQIICWDRESYNTFVNSPNEQASFARPQVQQALETLCKGMGLTPLESPFDYIKALQQDFPYEKIPFSNDYYDTLGLERPDGSQPPEQGTAFETVTIRIKK